VAEQGADWGLRAERLLERALYALRGGSDPLPLMSAAETAYRILLGELPESVMDGYPFPGEAVTPECICPPALLERGGFRGGCLVHSSLAVIPDEEER
jgi:hypothetical protein